MKYILTPEQMRSADATAINELGIPGEILMENAARSAAIYSRELLKKKYADSPVDILLLCGSGNNGGDGYALARHLFSDYDLTVLWIGSKEKMSPETRMNFEALVKMGVDLIHLEDAEMIAEIDFNYSCIIDSMIGVGGSENIRGLALELLKRVRISDSLNIAIDAPTGLNTETGAISGYCFEADMTITMFAIKTGMITGDGPSVCGEIVVADLGAPRAIVQTISNTYAIEDADIAGLAPVRKRISSKFDYGKVMIIAGSASYPGAAALAANSAICSGAGLVYLYSTAFHPMLMPEVIPVGLEPNSEGYISVNAYDRIMNDIDNMNVVAIGPGLGSSPGTVELVRMIIRDMPDDKPVIIDADGLRAIGQDTELGYNFVLTPHCGEFARLTGLNRHDIEDNALSLCREKAAKLQCNLLLKHVPAVVSDGEETYLTLVGNPGIASGGSGDVLTGIIAGILATGQGLLEAAALGSFVHGRAGDVYAEDFSMESLTASRLLESLKYVW